MISGFINLFKKSDGDEQRAFQRRVLAMLGEVQPECEYSPATDPLAIKLGEQVLGLTNLRASFSLTSQTDDDLRQLVTVHFQQVAAGLLDVDERTQVTWEEASPTLMPQLMPAEFLEKLDLVSVPFTGEIVVGFVLDGQKTYSYVTRSDSKRWDQDASDIYSFAIQNLERRSTGIEMAGFPGENPLMVVNTMDSFDAVRILLEGLRERIAGVVGDEFYFGVPNRDFLICWSSASDSDYQNKVRLQVVQDFEDRPYPLSPLVFQAKNDGEFVVVEPYGIDPRSLNASNN